MSWCRYLYSFHRCVQCGEMKYLRMIDRPTAYVCGLCRMVPPEKRATRVKATRKRKATA